MDPAKKRRILRWLIGSVFVGGGAIGIIFHNANTRAKEAAEDSARLAMEQDVRRLNAQRAEAEARARSQREDSLWTTFSTPDLRLMDLRGHVRSLTTDGDTTEYGRTQLFNEAGRWVNAPAWPEELRASLSPSYQRQARWQHDAQGYLKRKLDATQMDGEFAIDYTWRDGRVVRRSSPYGTQTFTFDEDGVPTGSTVIYNDANGRPELRSDITYSDYRYDDTGNWTQRRQQTLTRQGNGAPIRDDATVHRIIEYYQRKAATPTK